MRTRTKITSTSAQTGVTSAELKLFARIPDIAGETNLLSALLSSARDYVMRYTGYAFDQVIGVKVVVTDFTDEINNSKLHLELPIALMDGSYSSVVVTGYDENGDSTTLTSRTRGDDTLVVSSVDTGYEEIQVTYTATPSILPDAIQQAILLIASELYDERKVTIKGTITSETEFTVKNLLSGYRRFTSFYA